MSLINDALKRASQSDKNRPPQAALPSPMQPVAGYRRTRIPWLLAAFVMAVTGLALAGWFFWKWWESSHPIVVAAAVAPVQTVVAAPPAPIAPETPPPLAIPAQVAPVIPATPAPDAKPSWPIALTVKAIFYSKTSPRALVNGRTVEPGDRIEGVLVTGIEQDRVLVSWNGETKELRMGGE
jgi:hypothetical protein